MQSSYKIIKNKHIEYSDEGKVLLDIKLEEHPDEIEEAFKNDKETKENHVDSNLIKKEIEDKFTLENQKLREELLRKIEQEAREKAEIEIKKAEIEIEKAKEEASEIGYKDGLNKGYQRGVEEARDVCDEMKKSALSLIDQAKQEVDKYYIDNKNKLIKMAGDIAENIVNATIDLSSENILMLIRPIINLNERNELIVISCNPDNFESLKNSKPQLELAAPNARFVLLSDNNLERNGCIIENENQVIDLQIRKQINAILEEISNMED